MRRVQDVWNALKIDGDTHADILTDNVIVEAHQLCIPKHLFVLINNNRCLMKRQTNRSVIKRSLNRFTFFTVMQYKVVVSGTFLKSAMDFSKDNVSKSSSWRKNSCATMSSTIFESTMNSRISLFVQMKRSIKTNFIVSKNSIFSSLLAFLYFSHSTGCWLILCFS